MGKTWRESYAGNSMRGVKSRYSTQKSEFFQVVFLSSDFLTLSGGIEMEHLAKMG